MARPTLGLVGLPLSTEGIYLTNKELEEDLLEFEEEGEVDREGELVSALKEIDRLKLKTRKQKEILLKHVKEEPKFEDFIKLKIELVEARKLEDILL